LSDDCYRDMVDVMEATRISARELSRNTSEVLDRVAAGEKIEVTRNGVAIAIITPPDPVEVMTQGLIKAGVLSSDWRSEQAELKRWLTENPPLPSEPGERPLSEVLIEQRDEETR